VRPGPAHFPVGIELELKIKTETIIQNEVEVVSIHVGSGSASHVNVTDASRQYCKFSDVICQRRENVGMLIKSQQELSRRSALYVVCCRYYCFGIIRLELARDDHTTH